MEKVRKIYHKGKSILVVDYTGCKTDRMIEIFDTAKHWIQTENKPALVVSIFNKNYATPEFMRHVEKGLKEVESLIDCNAAIGLSDIQKWIVKGVNLWYKRQVYYFDTYNEALEFLAADKNDN